MQPSSLKFNVATIGSHDNDDIIAIQSPTIRTGIHVEGHLIQITTICVCFLQQG